MKRTTGRSPRQPVRVKQRTLAAAELKRRPGTPKASPPRWLKDLLLEARLRRLEQVEADADAKSAAQIEAGRIQAKKLKSAAKKRKDKLAAWAAQFPKHTAPRLKMKLDNMTAKARRKAIGRTTVPSVRMIERARKRDI